MEDKTLESNRHALSTLGMVAVIFVGFALIVGAYAAGHSSGREQSQQDRMEAQVKSLFESRHEEERRIDKLEEQVDRIDRRLGLGSAPGDAKK